MKIMADEDLTQYKRPSSASSSESSDDTSVEICKFVVLALPFATHAAVLFNKHELQGGGFLNLESPVRGCPPKLSFACLSYLFI